MLTPSEKLKIDICARKIRTGETDAKIAQHFGVNISTVARAIAWGRKRDIFRLDSEDKLRIHIQELRKIINTLEKELIRLRKLSKQNNTILTNHITGISRTLLDYRTRLMELEGLYKHVLNVEHSGNVETGIVFLPEKVDPKEWKKRYE